MEFALASQERDFLQVKPGFWTVLAQPLCIIMAQDSHEGKMQGGGKKSLLQVEVGGWGTVTKVDSLDQQRRCYPNKRIKVV